MSDTPVVPRVVPGAPPPTITAPKKHKRSRKPKKKAEDEAVPVEGNAVSAQGTPEAPEARELTPVPDIIEHIEIPEISTAEDDVLQKPSPIVKLVTKRYQANSRKIFRITSYVTMDPAKLNDDQKRSVKNLPTLEAVQKELGEVKAAIEAHEAELAQELANKRLELAKAEKARIYRAVSDAQAILETKTSGILNLLRLRSLIDIGALDISDIASDSERDALFSVTNVLLGGDSEAKEKAVNAVFSGFELHGVSTARLLEIVHLAFNPLAPVPQDENEGQQSNDADAEEMETPVVEISSTGLTGSLSFIQASEIETTSFEEGAEWVEKSDAAVHDEPVVNGEPPQAKKPPATLELPNSTIDWSADDEGLPSISNLHAQFGTSGSVTPAEPVVEQSQQPVDAEESSHVEESATDSAPAEDDDGFTQARGGRGRGGRGHRGGGERGRGGFRNGERGGFRGGRGERGGFRGERGGFRGGERGGFRGGLRGNGERGGYGGRGGGEWRGGDGERRGGRGGRGRGDRGGAHAHSSPAPAAAAA